MNATVSHEPPKRCGDYGHVSRQTGKPCRRYCVPGRDCCKFHGGNTLRGVAHPNYRGKGRSKYIPARLADAYEEAQDDPELLSTRNDIALVDARLADLLTRVDTGQAEQLWADVRKAHDDVRKAWANENYGALETALVNMDRAIGSGLADYAAWGEIQSLLETRRKLTESEQKRLVAMRQMISSEQAMAYAAALLAAVRENVEDRRVLMSIQASFERLLNREAVADGKD